MCCCHGVYNWIINWLVVETKKQFEIVEERREENVKEREVEEGITILWLSEAETKSEV